MLGYVAQNYAGAAKLFLSNLLGNGGTEVNFRAPPPPVDQEAFALVSMYLTAVLDLRTKLIGNKVNVSAPRMLQVLSRACGNNIPHKVPVYCLDKAAVEHVLRFPSASRKYGSSSLLLPKAVVETREDTQNLGACTGHGHQRNTRHYEETRRVAFNGMIFKKSKQAFALSTAMSFQNKLLYSVF